MHAGIDGLQLIGYNKVTSATDAIPLHYHKDTIEMDPFEGVNEQIWFHISRSLLYQHFKQQLLFLFCTFIVTLVGLCYQIFKEKK